MKRVATGRSLFCSKLINTEARSKGNSWFPPSKRSRMYSASSRSFEPIGTRAGKIAPVTLYRGSGMKPHGASRGPFGAETPCRNSQGFAKWAERVFPQSSPFCGKSPCGCQQFRAFWPQLAPRDPVQKCSRDYLVEVIGHISSDHAGSRPDSQDRWLSTQWICVKVA
jgi:hypothetical protein